ncbi:MAG: TonB-dependent receptor [Cyclobacteriaceae bacterium]|nr:TonB-dependent receptor [Cyclobacteriaceae bacterium]
MRKILLNLSLLLLLSLQALAQSREVSGTVTDQSDGSALAGVNIIVKGTAIGTATDGSGRFRIQVPNGASLLVVSFIGFVTQEVPLTESTTLAISLEPAANELQEVVISVGSRGPQRTITDTPLPVDNFTAKELQTTGQLTFDKALQYRVPSFNTVNTPVNDATSLFDPYEIRNLGPSRTLILINGKRKNLTALVYTQTSPGRGETGADLSAIPTDAIKRIEILRDGASAQYGSDAIAGVMNVILKDRYEGTTVSVNTGSTFKYGGAGYGINYNSGANFGDKGFINYNLSFNRQESAIRKDPIDAARDFSDLTDGSPTAQSAVNAFLQRFPDGLNKNGTPDNTSAKFLINTAIPVGNGSEVYANAAYVYRKTRSFANYRQPYWRIDQGLLHKRIPGAPDYTGVDYEGGPNGAAVQAAFAADKAAGLYQGYIGYQPSFDGDLSDYNGTIGFRTADLGGWKQDMSLTVGGNKMLFTVDNTVNRALVKNSPTSFKPGGFAFNHLVGNIDFSRPISDKLFIALGSEFRSENWELIAGDTASYSSEGANSFPGFQQQNAIRVNRFNFGAYADITWDITEHFLIGGTYRSEIYSDFGSANVYKLTSRYKFGESFTLRGSVSSGFRAPTLHQQYLSLTQASFVGGDIVNTGLANNVSKEARLIGVPKLKAEKANNISFGFGLNPSSNFSLTVDYYQVRIKDRIIYSNEVSDNIQGVQIDNISFFINAAETKTSGVDFVASYRNLPLGRGKVVINLAGNYTIKNELVGGYQALNTNFGYDIYNQTQESILTTSRPKSKIILGLDYSVGKFSVNLNNTLFGKTTFNNADLNENLTLEFIPNVVTDLGVQYNFTSNFSGSLTLQNLLNRFPEYKLKANNAAGESILANPAQVKDEVNNITFNGRYPVLTYDGSQFSQLGSMYLLQFNYKF